MIIARPSHFGLGLDQHCAVNCAAHHNGGHRMSMQSHELQEAQEGGDHQDALARELTAWELLRLVHKRVIGAHDNPPNARGVVHLTPSQARECDETPFLMLVLFALYAKRWVVAFWLFIVAGALLETWDASH